MFINIFNIYIHVMQHTHQIWWVNYGVIIIITHKYNAIWPFFAVLFSFTFTFCLWFAELYMMMLNVAQMTGSPHTKKTPQRANYTFISDEKFSTYSYIATMNGHDHNIQRPILANISLYEPIYNLICKVPVWKVNVFHPKITIRVGQRDDDGWTNSIKRV